MAQASRWLLALGISGSALAVGTVHTITLCVVTGVLAVAAVLGWWGAEPMRARAPATILLFTGVGLTAYTALQCVPMPIGLLAAIAPHNAEVWSRALLAAGGGGAAVGADHARSDRHAGGGAQGGGVPPGVRDGAAGGEEEGSRGAHCVSAPELRERYLEPLEALRPEHLVLGERRGDDVACRRAARAARACGGGSTIQYSGMPSWAYQRSLVTRS